jgi:hypothetical protein
MAHFIIHTPLRPRHTSDRPLIGITGKAGAGKDTVGTAIQANFGDQIEQLSFATPLKQALASMLGVSYDMVEGKTEQSREWRELPLPGIGKTPRELMLSLGTEWGRDMVHGDLWVILTGRMFDRLRGHTGAYFTDVRFDNEADMIRKLGGVVVEVRRSDDAVQSEAAAAHSSEAGINKRLIDATVIADKGDLDGLQSMALSAIRELGCRPSY